VTSNNACEHGEQLIVLANSDDESDLYCCLLPRCEALRTCSSGFPIATRLSASLEGLNNSLPQSAGEAWPLAKMVKVTFRVT